jgi:hypothetical protein
MNEVPCLRGFVGARTRDVKRRRSALVSFIPIFPLGTLEDLARSKTWNARRLGTLEDLERSKTWNARRLGTHEDLERMKKETA